MMAGMETPKETLRRGWLFSPFGSGRHASKLEAHGRPDTGRPNTAGPNILFAIADNWSAKLGRTVPQ